MSAEVTFFELRAIVRFCVLRGLSNGDIQGQLVEAYGANAPSLEFVKKWARRFREGRVSLEDDERSGHPQLRRLGRGFLSIFSASHLPLFGPWQQTCCSPI